MDEVGKDLKQRTQGQTHGDKNKYTMWGLLNISKFKVQIKCKGSGRKSKSKIPRGFYSTGDEESLKHLRVVE